MTNYNVELPYNGTSGWSGTETSRERAERDDKSGITKKRQTDILVFIDKARAYGATVKEIREILNLHHGQASGALSVLHKTGHLAQLIDRRDGCHIYVLPQNANGRPVRLPLGTTNNPEKSAIKKIIRLHFPVVEYKMIGDIEMSWVECCECKTKFPCNTMQLLDGFYNKTYSEKINAL